MDDSSGGEYSKQQSHVIDVDMLPEEGELHNTPPAANDDEVIDVDEASRQAGEVICVDNSPEGQQSETVESGNSSGGTPQAPSGFQEVSEDQAYLLNVRHVCMRPRTERRESTARTADEIFVQCSAFAESPKFEEDEEVRAVTRGEIILDGFQRVAMACIAAGESVLVCAHTSSGKTAVGEYALRKALSDNRRVVYTTPIKALSNQKFREFQELFGEGSVGLVTGDVSLCPDAPIVVMTTEILRSMLYHRGGDMNDVAWIIFDEVHYLKDLERGVVWEESIVLAPQNCRMVFLSATLPNPEDFAEWVAALHKQPVHMVATNTRPTPLEHYLLPAGGKGMYLTVTHTGEFLQTNFDRANKELLGGAEDSTSSRAAGGDEKKPKHGGPTADLFRCVQRLVEDGLTPSIVFSFSRRECEALASACVGKFQDSLLTEDDKANVTKVFEAATEQLSEEDKAMPQVTGLLPVLMRGVGVHHSGLLPILKEVVEILFQEGLIKILFATETFAIGLNMPARCCVFSSARKFDGRISRWLTGGEYVQMSGRAGRRGIDDKGTCVIMLEEPMEESIARAMLMGKADALTSNFRVEYHLILNATRSSTTPESIISRSFALFCRRKTDAHGEEASQLRKEAEDIVVENENILESLDALKQLRLSKLLALSRHTNQPSAALPFLVPGRIVRMPGEWGWGVVVAWHKRTKPESGKPLPSEEEADRWIIDVLVGAKKHGGTIAPTWPDLVYHWTHGDKDWSRLQGFGCGVVPFVLSCIQGLSTAVLDIPQPLEGNAETILKAMFPLVHGDQNTVPLLHPVNDQNLGEDTGVLFDEIASLEKRLAEHKGTDVEKNNPQLLALWEKKKTLLQKAHEIDHAVQGADEFSQSLRQRSRVLKRLGFITQDDAVSPMGRAACEIEVSDDLVLVWSIFQGALKGLGPAAVAALCSVFVVEEVFSSTGQCATVLKAQLGIIEEAQKKVQEVEYSLNMAEAVIKELNTSAMDLVHAWCHGLCSFSDVMAKTDAFEGSVVRMLRRLGELLRQISLGCQAVGDEEQAATAEQARDACIRGVVGAGSLYI